MFLLTLASLINKSRPIESTSGSFTLTVKGKRFSLKALKPICNWSPDFVTGTKFPANSTYWGFPSSTCVKNHQNPYMSCHSCDKVAYHKHRKWKKKNNDDKLTSTSLLLATSVKFSWCSKVLSSLSSVIQNTLSLASIVSTLLANTTNLFKKKKKNLVFPSVYFFLPFRLMRVCYTYLDIKGTCIASLYSSVAIFVASPTFRQSMSQNLADTVVVNETQSLTNVRGVEPVTSSHWARDVPPMKQYSFFKMTTNKKIIGQRSSSSYASLFNKIFFSCKKRFIFY